MRGYTYGGAGTAKRRSIAFALIFFGSILHQGKKEQHRSRKLFAKQKSFQTCTALAKECYNRRLYPIKRHRAKYVDILRSSNFVNRTSQITHPTSQIS